MAQKTQSMPVTFTFPIKKSLKKNETKEEIIKNNDLKSLSSEFKRYSTRNEGNKIFFVG